MTRAKGKPQRAGPEPGKAGPEVFPHQLRAGDVVLYEHGDAWELLGRPTKSVGTQDFVTTTGRVDRPVVCKLLLDEEPKGLALQRAAVRTLVARRPRGGSPE